MIEPFNWQLPIETMLQRGSSQHNLLEAHYTRIHVIRELQALAEHVQSGWICRSSWIHQA